MIAGLTLLYFVRKYYLSYNLMRLDPLEDSYVNKELLQTAENTTNLWLIGDSRIAKWDKNLLLPLGANIVNLGIEGQTTSQVLNRLRYYLEEGNPQWLILEVGINDLKIIGINKKYASWLVESCFDNISKIAELCLARNINIIVINIFPTGKIEILRRMIWNSSVDTSLIEVNKKLEEYCKRNGIIFYDTSTFLYNDDYRIKELYQDGFLHLNDEAYEVLSKNIINEFGTRINSTLINNN